MIRPLTILCLADLHVGERENVDTIFSNLQHLISNEASDNPYKRPDFLMIAGDLINAGSITKDTGIEKLYSEVRDNIRILCKKLDLPGHRVIMVPGNHDKYLHIRKDLKNVVQSKDLTDDFDSDEIDWGNYIKDLKNVRAVNGLNKDESDLSMIDWDSYKENFRPYCNCYRSLLSGEDGRLKWDKTNYFWNEKYLGDLTDGIGLVSGLKVFPELKVCFLLINTEWTYYKGDDRFQHERYLIPLFLKEALQEYMYKYPDYKLITVMHRNPYELSWTEKYGFCAEDAYIYSASDIIFTGHQHSENDNVPHMMANSAQLLNLGSLAKGHKNDNIHRASLVIIDPMKDESTFEILSRDIDSNRWKVHNVPRTFNLKKNSNFNFNFNFNFNSNFNSNSNSNSNSRLLTTSSGKPFETSFLSVIAKSKDLFDVESSIKRLFPQCYNPVMVNCDRFEDEIKKLDDKLNEDGIIIVAIYGFICKPYVQRNLTKLKQQTKERYPEQFLSRKLVIQTVVIYLLDMNIFESEIRCN